MFDPERITITFDAEDLRSIADLLNGTPHGHKFAVLARHTEAYGDEHDEDCPICGVDSNTEED